MLWRVVVSGDQPEEEAVAALSELTGLGRGEVLLSLRRGDLIAGTGISLERARELALQLGSDYRLAARVVPLSEDPHSSAQQFFRVILTGYRPGSRARLRAQLEKLSGLPPERVALWMSKIPFVLRRGVDQDTARTIKRRMQTAGALVELRPDAPPPAGSAAGSAGPARSPRASRVISAIADTAVSSSPPPPEPADVPPVIETVKKGSRTGTAPHVFSFSPPVRAIDFAFDPPPIPVSKTDPPVRFEFVPPPTLPGALPPLLGPAGHPPPRSRKNARRPGTGAAPVPRPGPGTRVPEVVYRAVLHSPCDDELDVIAQAISEKLGIELLEAVKMLGECPLVLATFDSVPDLVEWTRELEEAGATISVARGEKGSDPSLDPGRDERGEGGSDAPGFLGWLTGCRG